jgi:hypothetical protein
MSRWVVLVMGLLVVAAMGITISALTSDGASGWSDPTLRVVGGPVVADGTAVVLNVTSGHEMELSGVRPTDGSVAWTHPFSSSEITPGVGFTPIAIGSTVLLLAPVGESSNPEVTVEGVNAVTGKVLWSVPQALALSDAPVVCGSGAYFCLSAFVSPTETDQIAVTPASGAVVGVTAGLYRSMGVAAPGTVNDSDLWQTSEAAPTFTQTSTSGHRLWTESVATLFGGSQFDPDYGWDFIVTGNLDIGSVGVAPVGDTEQLGGFKTVGISTSSGAVAWSLPGYFQCGGGLQFLTSDVLCRFTGSAHAKGQSETMAGVGVTLEGFDSASGATTWSRQVLDPPALALGTNVAFADSTHLVVQLLSGKRVVLDVNNGTTAPVSDNEVFWCEQTPSYRIHTAPGASSDGKRVSEPLFRSCSATGAPVSSTPTTVPTTVGVSVGGRFVWPTPAGLKAIPSAQSS